MKLHNIVVLILLVSCPTVQVGDKVAKAAVRDNAGSISISPNNRLKQTPTFTVNEKVKDVMMLYVLRGMKQKFGFIDKPLVTGEECVLEWLFWRKNEKLPLGELKITAVHAGSGSRLAANGKLTIKRTPIRELPKGYSPQPVSLNTSGNDVPVSIATTLITFNETGIWNLQLFSNGEMIGNMNVLVTEKKNPLLTNDILLW
ncbi:hypothetical protein ACQKKK_00130 [Peribacillus sp. NPDC006672]|uniref:hypothetical protein n=1 Tax=Peribacillus sp. NPDC006672 TaxID=3390606 RepID=UPI003CFF1D53